MLRGTGRFAQDSPFWVFAGCWCNRRPVGGPTPFGWLHESVQLCEIRLIPSGRCLPRAVVQWLQAAPLLGSGWLAGCIAGTLPGYRAQGGMQVLCGYTGTGRAYSAGYTYMRGSDYGDASTRLSPARLNAVAGYASAYASSVP